MQVATALPVRLIGLIFALSAGLASLAHAAEQCKIIDGMPKAPVLKEKKFKADVHDLQFVYSWSPFHCKKIKGPKNKKKQPGGAVQAWDARFQCEENDFGFVVHGLWPQAKGKTGKEGQPRACVPTKPIARETLRKHLCTVPGVRLMQNEWVAHGTCHWKTAETYFGDIEKLADSYPMPSLAELQGKDVPVNEIVSAIVAGSQGKLTTEMIGVRVQQIENRRSLQEIYICFDLDQKPKACAHQGTPGHLKALVLPVP